MTNRKISELEAVTTVNRADVLPIVQSTTTRKASVSEVFEVLEASDLPEHDHTISDVTGLQTALDAKATVSHVHSIDNVTGLQTALDGKATASDISTAISVHVAEANPHAQYVQGDDLGSAAFADETEFAPAIHGHSIDAITGLQTALDGKQTALGYTPLNSASNLSDLANAATSRTNLGLGSAAVQDSSAFATAAQGGKADTALQPSAIGSTVQAHDADLDTIAALSPSTGNLLIRGASAWEARNLLAADVPSLDAAKITSGILNSARIPDLSSTYQPLDSDLTAIAALTTTSFGRGFLGLANAAEARLNSWGMDIQFGATKPTIRTDGSALQVGDRWLDIGDRRIWFLWNGTYWVSEQIFRTSATLSALSSGVNLGLLEAPNGYNLFLLDFGLAGFLTNNSETSYFEAAYQYAWTGGAVVTEATISTSAVSTANFVQRLTPNVHRDAVSLGLLYYRVAITRVGTTVSISHPIFAMRYRLAKP